MVRFCSVADPNLFVGIDVDNQSASACQALKTVPRSGIFHVSMAREKVTAQAAHIQDLPH